MTGSVLSTGDGHQGWQDKLSIMMVLELSICLKTGAMTLKTVLDKGYGSVGLAGVELNDHIKFTFKWEWLVSIIMLVFAVIVGIE